MQTNNNPAEQSPDKTSTTPKSAENTGESIVQDGETVVNEQEQNKPVNQEEFIDDAAQNTKKANEDDHGTLPVN